MPDLYTGIFHELVSPKHLREPTWNAKQLELVSGGALEDAETACDLYNNRAASVRRHAVELCELIAGGQAGGSCMSLARVENELLLTLCGASKRGMGIFCGKDISCSWDTGQSVLQGLLEQKKIDLGARIAACKTRNDVCLLEMIENYVTLQWPKKLLQ
jgi:hypothetical protein